MIVRSIIFLLVIAFFISCDKGIEPSREEVQTGFSGTISFIGNWPPNITATRIVLFKNPLLSEADFNFLNVNYVSEEIPPNSVFYEFTTTSSEAVLENVKAGSYAYLAVAQSTLDTIALERSAWFVSGIYTSQSEPNVPKTLIISDNTFEQNINIVCDFNNPPPQPPGGK